MMPAHSAEPSADARSLEAYARAYVEHLKARNYAAQSVVYKHAALTWFIAWCRERGIRRIEAVTRPVLQRYQRHLFHAAGRNGKPLSVQSQCNRLIAIRTWFRFLARENLLLYNPASELELPRRGRRLPKHTLTAREAEQVLAQPDLASPEGLRDRAILEVLYSTGIRRQELIGLERRDLNPAQGVLAVRQGKGRKDRFVPIGARALAWVEKYLADGRPEAPGENTLFLDRTGCRLDPHRLSRAVKRYIAAADIGKQGSCHLFRHTMATLMLENGADLRFIQQMLGHAMLATTEIYTHVAIHQLKAVHTATHPARLKVPDASPETDDTIAVDTLEVPETGADEDMPS